MSFLNEIIQKKENLKSCHTVVTSLSGNKLVELKNDLGETEIRKLPEICQGFVVDEKPDLQIAEIKEYLYLGSQDVAQNFDLLKKNNITHVLSIGVDVPTLHTACNIKFRKIELYDEPSEDISKAIDSSFEFIKSVRKESEKNKILVHCNAGYSRAPTIVIAYLMKKYRYSLNESFYMVNQKRNIKPNNGFMEKLKKLENSF